MDISVVLTELENYSPRGAPTRLRLDMIAGQFGYKYRKSILKRELYDGLVEHILRRVTQDARPLGRHELLLEEMGEVCTRYRAPFVPRLYQMAQELGLSVRRNLRKQEIYDIVKDCLLRVRGESAAPPPPPPPAENHSQLLHPHLARLILEIGSECSMCGEAASSVLRNGRALCDRCLCRRRALRSTKVPASVVSLLASLAGEPCPVCLNDLTEPVLTACGHLYCCECLRHLQDVCHRCAVCRGSLS